MMKIGIINAALFATLALTASTVKAAVFGSMEEDGPCIGNLTRAGCTANDVRIGNVSVLMIIDDGCTDNNDNVTFLASYEVLSGAVSRYDVGVWFSTDGDQSALFGECKRFSLDSTLDLDDDMCGDISSASPVHQNFTITVPCLSNNGFLSLPYCTSWDNNDKDYCQDTNGTLPGTSSKCMCGDLAVTDIPVPPVSSDYPSEAPTMSPSGNPSSTPSKGPSVTPTSSPSKWPTSKPSHTPSQYPQNAPSFAPSQPPSERPSSHPASSPSSYPSYRARHTPSSVPSKSPSSAPLSSSPTFNPSIIPSSEPSCRPSAISPSTAPGISPSLFFSMAFSMVPSSISAVPSGMPSALPTSVPSTFPSIPIPAPSSFPSTVLSVSPSFSPSSFPSFLASSAPSASPSVSPSSTPSSSPSEYPSSIPSHLPKYHPTSSPSSPPSSFPTRCPADVAVACYKCATFLECYVDAMSDADYFETKAFLESTGFCNAGSSKTECLQQCTNLSVYRANDSSSGLGSLRGPGYCPIVGSSLCQSSTVKPSGEEVQNALSNFATYSIDICSIDASVNWCSGKCEENEADGDCSNQCNPVYNTDLFCSNCPGQSPQTSPPMGPASSPTAAPTKGTMGGMMTRRQLWLT